MYLRLLTRPSRRKAIPFERLGCRRQLVGHRPEPVRRLVCITAIGVEDSRGHGGFVFDRLFLPLLLSHPARTKDGQEAAIRASSHSIGSSSGPPCSPMTQLVGASGPSPTSQASKTARLHAPMSLGSWWSN